MSILRSSCALGLMLTWPSASAAAQSYAQQGYDQQYPQAQQQLPQPQPQYPQYPPQQQYEQQQPPPGYFPTPDAQGALNYTAPNGPYPDAQQVQSAASNAQLVSSVAGAFQLSGGISLIQVNSLSMKQDMMAASIPPVTMTTPPAMVAAAAPVDPVVTTCCVVKHPLFVELGYGVSNNIVIGGLFQFASASESVNNGAIPAKDLIFSFAPKFDYQFSPTSRFNPFLGGALNVTYENKTYFGLKDSRMLFGLALRGGLRYFVLDGLSLDPVVSLGYGVGSGTQQNMAKQPNSNSDYSVSNLHFAISMGMSIWLK
jgi:hypothetical protein